MTLRGPDHRPAGGALEPQAASLATLSSPERFTALGTGADGLASTDVPARRARAGWNDPVVPTRRHRLLPLLRNFTHTLALLLWFAGGLALAAGIEELAFAVAAVIVINGVFAAAQEYRAERLVQGLMRRVAVQAHMIRDGVVHTAPARELVPGDVVLLAGGDIVPADCVLVGGDEIALDLSMLTGETVPVVRTAEAAVSVPPDVHVTEVPAVAPAGAAVISGSATALVWATGPRSTLGQIATLVEGVRRGDSSLERQVRALSWTTAVIAVLTGTATLALATGLTDTSFATALTFATGVIVALVPEGMLPTLSVALAIGARRMASRGAAVRRLAAVEIVGSATVICTDKTGTLTENVLSVLRVTARDGSPASADGPAGLVAALCGNARLEEGHYTGDSIDVALAEWARAAGLDPEVLRARYRRTAETPFDAHRRYMTVSHLVDGHAVEFVKGAPEAVLAAFDLEVTEPLRVAMDRAAEAGERVLLLAARAEGESARIEGLVELFDRPRPEVPAAIAACREAGISVVMLTGDHPATARSVARQVGLDDGTGLPVTEGTELDAMSDQAVLRLLRGNAIFARIHPEQKLRIVTVLRQAGAVVVVTGDGINDAPALRAADVGVAMGARGTEVAKQAADIVLADDNFATLVAAIEEGRSLKRNIRRFVSYVFTSNVAEVMPFLSYVFLQIPLPLAVIQALAIDVGTDLAPALALGAEPPAAKTMQAPPEPPAQPLMTRALAVRTFLVFGLAEAALGLAAYTAYHLWTGWRPPDAMDAGLVRAASTLTFLGIVGGQVGCLFAQRDGSLGERLSFRSNGLLAVGLLSELVLAPALVYVPGLNTTFSMAPVHPAWLLVIPVGAAVFLLIDLARRAVDRRRPGGGLPIAATTRASRRG
ncbi:MAG: cation-transporting P-type ATPase [Dehalococcoidia bacterium]